MLYAKNNSFSAYFPVRLLCLSAYTCPAELNYWLASFGDVFISFEIEISISEDDDSPETIHHRSVIDNFYVMLV